MANRSVRVLLLAGLAVLAVAALVHPFSADARTSRVALLEQIDDYRLETWRWERLMQAPRTPTAFSERETPDEAYRVWIRDLWRNRAARAERRAQAVPNREAWLCIHRYERDPAQGWATHTGNGYYGGLQMDVSFQRTYGPELYRAKGTANNWTAIEQMWVAQRAYESGRGFYPWPNTARACGLI